MHIKEWLRQNKLTQKDLAKLLFVSPQSISTLCNRKVSLSKARKRQFKELTGMHPVSTEDGITLLER